MFPSASPPNHHVQFALKSSVRFTPPSLHPPKIAKSDLPSNHLYDLCPPHRNCQVRFTLKLPSPIYPQIICTIYSPPKSPSLIYPQIAKSDLPSNCQVRFTLKSSVRFTPPKSPSPIYPQIAKSDLPPNRLYDLPPPLKSSNFEQNFKRTQHHALLHKGIFCERPISDRKATTISKALGKTFFLTWLNFRTTEHCVQSKSSTLWKIPFVKNSNEN